VDRGLAGKNMATHPELTSEQTGTSTRTKKRASKPENQRKLVEKFCLT